MLLAKGKGEDWEALATAALISPAPGFWPMWRRAGWLRKREEGRPPPWPPDAPSMTLLPPSRLERGSWPPLAARAEGGEEGIYLNLTGKQQQCSFSSSTKVRKP